MTTSILATLGATIAHYKSLFHHNDEILASVEAANAQSPNWLRTPPTCTKHPYEPMFQLLVETPEHKKGDWICHSCADEERFARLESEQAALPIISKLPDYYSGKVVQGYHYTLEQAIRAATTPDVTKLPTLPRSADETPESVQAFLPKSTTSELPAKDIVYDNTPPIDDDITERVPVVRVAPPASRATVEIPAITGEILLMEIMRGPSSLHDTGEQEPITLQAVNEDAFLL